MTTTVSSKAGSFRLDVLNLVPTKARFYDQQVDVLESRNVNCTTLVVPGGTGSESSHTVAEYLRYYPRVLRRSLDDFDLIHANFGLTAPHAVAQPRLPVVVSLWGTDIYGRYGPMSKFAARFADAVIVMSEEMRRAVPGDPHVIPHGVNMDLFRPTSQRDARRELGWDLDAHQVFFPYPADREVKNYDLASRVVDRVGDRLDESVELQTVWGVPHDRMPVYMNAADSLLLTSEWEGSPNSVKEAMACNLPVVSVDVGDVARRVADDPHSHVCRGESELVDRLAETLARGEPSRGREAIRDLSLERMGDRIRRVYESVLSDETTATRGRRDPARH